MSWRTLAASLLLAFQAPAADLAREFTVAPQALKDVPDFVTQVVVPEATCAAVNEAGTLLVIGSKAPGEKQLAVIPLTAGKPGEPVWLTLPKPEALAAKASYPLGLQFHPRLPILYVWQDIDAPPGDKQDKNPEFKDYLEFDHLLVYAIKDGALELVQSGARGNGFHCGLKAGTVGLDWGAKNLFAPNAVGETWDEAGIAFFALDDEGLPGDAPEAGNDQGAKPIKNTTLAKGKKAPHLVPVPKRVRTGHYFPSGTGWVAGSDALIMGGVSGCLMADFHNDGLRHTWFGIPELTGSCTIAGHPTLPAMYLCLQDSSHLYEVAQVNGLITLLPQIATVTGAHLAGLPVVLTRQSLLAVADTKSVHFFGLQAEGKLDGSDQQLPLPGGVGKGLAYSDKLGRLFVAVEKAN